MRLTYKYGIDDGTDNLDNEASFGINHVRYIRQTGAYTMPLDTFGVMAQESAPLPMQPRVVAGPLVSNGQFVVRFSGSPGFTYTVEATDDLGTPPWSKKTNLTAPTTDQGFGVGVFQFSESIGTATTRFYRTVYPSY